MRLIIVCAGGRGAGKSFTAARLAQQLPAAKVIEEHPYGEGEHDHCYSQNQHISGAWDDVGGKPYLVRDARDRLRGARIVILCATDQVHEKIMIIQAMMPVAIISAGAFPLREI